MSDSSPYFDQIGAYLNGELTGASLQFFESALATDPELAEEVGFQRQMKEAAEQRSTREKAARIMARLRSDGIIEKAYEQAAEAEKLLRTVQGDPQKIDELLAKHPALADWKSLDPDGFAEAAGIKPAAASPKQARIVPLWRRAAAVAAVLIVGAAALWWASKPSPGERIEWLYAANEPAIIGKFESSGFAGLGECTAAFKEAYRLYSKGERYPALLVLSGIAAQNQAAVFGLPGAAPVPEACDEQTVRLSRIVFARIYQEIVQNPSLAPALNTATPAKDQKRKMNNMLRYLNAK